MRSIPGQIALSLVCISTLLAQNAAIKPQNPNPVANEYKGMPPRATPGDYATHVQVGDYTLAVDFDGHNVPRPEGPLTTEDYVVVEAALFGPAGSHASLSPQDFSLHINDKKPMTGSSFVMVASSIRDPEWIPPEKKDKPKTSFGGGGNSEDTSTIPPKPPIDLLRKWTMYIRDASIPEADKPLPTAGLLFFPYRGKTQNIHLLELIYSGPGGKATVTLQP